MKKYSLLIIALLHGIILFGQAPEIKTDLPTIIPPSPTVAGLMKFEEIPVSNYTGIPDISIPLYSTGTLSKDINLNISLNYHPASIAADERASDVGLGWSLMAGGTISRTVRGIPDEMFKMGTQAKIGIYHNSSSNHHYQNDYNHIIDVLADENTSEFDVLDEALWNSQVRGSHDTEHDLWQFNFMGMSGRFYIKKNTSNQLEVVPLDDYRVKIVNFYGNSNNTYLPTSFEIYDEKGYKYKFDVIEVTTSNSTTYSTDRMTHNQGSSISPSIIVNTSFHLSKIFDNNNNTIVEFLYNSAPIKEITIDKSLTVYNEDIQSNFIPIYTYGLPPCGLGDLTNFNPYPFESLSSSQRSTAVKKLQQIQIKDIAKIDFNYLKGREDDNLHNPDSSYVFKGIMIKDWAGNNIKKVVLTHGYLATKEARMSLQKVSFQNFLNAKEESYELFYKINSNPLERIVNKDNWGYFNLRPIPDIGGFYREVSPNFCDSEILQKMKLPTGGCIIFDFEPNTFAFIGQTQLPNYDANPENWTELTIQKNFSTSANNKTAFFSIADAQTVVFETSINVNDTGWMFRLYEAPTSEPDVLIGSFSYDNCGAQNCVFSYPNLPAGSYKIEFFDANNITSFLATIKAYYKVRSGANKEYVYGGGNRIKTIGYFTDGATDQKFYQIGTTGSPQKEKKFSYNFFANFLKSSGSLVFGIPKFDYAKQKRECVLCMGSEDYILNKNDQMAANYNIATTFNNFNPVKTKGSDVGYKNVKVYENNNGYTEYEYSTAFDFPEDLSILNLSPPFLPTKNYDYKRGLLKAETTYNQSNQKLAKTDYVYEFEDHLETTGFRTYYLQSDFINIYSFSYFLDYKNYISSCYQYETNATNPAAECNNRPYNDPDCHCFCYFGKVREFTDYALIEEAYGWAKLVSKSTKNYFYEGSTQKTVQTDETYTYNTLNKQISEQTTTNSFGEVLKTKYFYHIGNSIHSQNRISEIEKVETYRGVELLSTSKINYVNTFPSNVSFLPQTIQTSKGSASLENRVKYNAYDKYGHPLEVQQENGTVISYLWGYNNSQPIAKIENATNAQIKSAIGITDLNLVSEANLSAINSWRTNASFANTLITTYTYIPLVGVSTITDPKGDKITYEYDEFNRLKVVRDKNNNILSENEYHYKTQN